MPRIDSRDPAQRWRLACPTPHRHRGRSLRVVDGYFECRQCEELFEQVIDIKTGERLHREDVELVGTGADTKGAFGQPTVE